MDRQQLDTWGVTSALTDRHGQTAARHVGVTSALTDRHGQQLDTWWSDISTNRHTWTAAACGGDIDMWG